MNVGFAFELGAIVTLKGFLVTEPRQRLAVVARRIHEEPNGQVSVTYCCRAMDRDFWPREQRISWGPTKGLGLHEFCEHELMLWEDLPEKEEEEEA